MRVGATGTDVQVSVAGGSFGWEGRTEAGAGVRGSTRHAILKGLWGPSNTTLGCGWCGDMPVSVTLFGIGLLADAAMLRAYWVRGASAGDWCLHKSKEREI